ncbi:uncharacterized protein METZ01_LOCUS353566 [marine metagenome]|uniref:Uncharacterized protein n=1 Tax=marine metagenome TaxID=408172 RepID=A0A382RTU9_9ZZZZ
MLVGNNIPDDGEVYAQADGVTKLYWVEHG